MLSQYHHVSGEFKTSEPILPATVMVTPIMWDLDSAIGRVVLNSAVPCGYPLGLVYMPAHFRGRVVEWPYITPVIGHPGIMSTLHTIRGKYWWPQMDRVQWYEGGSVLFSLHNF